MAPPRRRDAPALPPAASAEPTKRASFKDALVVLASTEATDRALEDLQTDFYSNASRPSVVSKREAMTNALELACRGDPPFPLTGIVICRVAASLKAAKLTSADKYLNELRLMHIERGYDVPAWMARLFDQAKTSVNRAKGPPKKAPELELKNCINRDVEGCGANDVLHPWASYVTANAWLLREIELAHVTLGDVSSLKRNGKTWVQLQLPVSKNDSHGTGCARALPHAGCSSGPFSDDPCPACAVLEQELRVLELFGDDLCDDEVNRLPLFPTRGCKVATKFLMTDAWGKLAPPAAPRPTGHTARRSGSKKLARAGWCWPSIRFHGRWQSMVVLDYLESAIAESELGQAFEGGANATTALDARIARLETLLKSFAKVKQNEEISLETLRNVANEAADRVRSEAEFDTVNFSGGRTHRLASYATSKPSVAWRTKCGKSLVWETNFILGRVADPPPNAEDRCRICYKDEFVLV